MRREAEGPSSDIRDVPRRTLTPPNRKPVMLGGSTSSARSGSDIRGSRADPRKTCRRYLFGGVTLHESMSDIPGSRGDPSAEVCRTYLGRGVTPPQRYVGHACRRGDPSAEVCRTYLGRGVTPPQRYVGHACRRGDPSAEVCRTYFGLGLTPGRHVRPTWIGRDPFAEVCRTYLRPGVGLRRGMSGLLVSGVTPPRSMSTIAGGHASFDDLRRFVPARLAGRSAHDARDRDADGQRFSTDA